MTASDIVQAVRPDLRDKTMTAFDIIQTVELYDIYAHISLIHVWVWLYRCPVLSTEGVIEKARG